MGSSDRIEVNTLKMLPAKISAFVQQITKSVDFRVKRPDYFGISQNSTRAIYVE